jgi:hypothetical protein
MHGLDLYHHLDMRQVVVGVMMVVVVDDVVAVARLRRLVVVGRTFLYCALIGSHNICSDEMLPRQCQMLANIWFQTGNISTFQHLNLTFGARKIFFFKCECQMWRTLTFSTFDI